MAGVLEEIKNWATGLKYWEQATLEKIATRSELAEDDYKELVRLWEQDAGLAEVHSGRPRLSFSDPSAGAARPRARLLSLRDLSNVNALPQGQELPFGPQLTLIFGANGTGKTGYARPLGSAGFARGTREVLPNAEANDHSAIPTAEIGVLIEGRAEPTQIRWEAGRRCPELAGFYAFDAQSLDAHLELPNAMCVIPSALRLLTRLADETDEVRRRVRAVIERLVQPHSFAEGFQGDSSVSRLVRTLGPDTDVQELRRMATVTGADEAEREKIERQIAELKLQPVAQRLRVKQQEISDLESLLKHSREAAQATSQEAEETAGKLLGELRDCRRLAVQFGSEQFACGPLSQVGTEVWRDFIASARRLAQAEETAAGIPYPQQGAPCLLCQQALSASAAGLIERLWQFLASDAQKRLRDARSACDQRAREIEAVPLNYFGEDSSVRRLLEAVLPNAVQAIEASAESAAARVKEFVASLRDGQERKLPPLVTADVTELQHMIEIRKGEARQLGQTKEGDRLKTLEASLRDLLHRKGLAAKLPEIEQYVRGRRWARTAERELGTTGQITRKYNELFESLVTDRYKASFQSLLDRFGRNLRVSVDTRGHKGQTIRQLVLTPSEFPAGQPIAKILSEGEKNAVALADFLAEAATDDACDGLVLDDPVTSFDAGWKEALAAYLVEQAGSRCQVVIFTHDLVFLYHIHTRATESGVEFRTHWVHRRGKNPGFLLVDGGPACERKFRTPEYAEECLRRSEGLPPDEQQRVLENGFDALRTSYEALVVFDLFGGVVQRFDERLRLDLLNQVRFDSAVAREVSAKWAHLSRYIGAHLHSDAYAPEKPTPEKLRDEITAFYGLRKKVKELKRARPEADAHGAGGAQTETE